MSNIHTPVEAMTKKMTISVSSTDSDSAQPTIMRKTTLDNKEMGDGALPKVKSPATTEMGAGAAPKFNISKRVCRVEV